MCVCTWSLFGALFGALPAGDDDDEDGEDADNNADDDDDDGEDADDVIVVVVVAVLIVVSVRIVGIEVAEADLSWMRMRSWT